MNIAIDEFEKQIEKIKLHLDILEKYDQIIRNQHSQIATYIKNNISDEKVFNYRSNIISLYGAFEHFIESVIQEYIEKAQKFITSFDGWGDKITKNYL